ncbi:hypothetical protein ACVFYP_15220 [Roseomonas sp. F4]
MRNLPLRHLPIRLAQWLCCLLLLACGAVPQATLAQSPAQAQIPIQAQGDPSFQLVNRGSQAIREIYVSPSEDRYWGHDWLEANVLPAGGRFPVRIAPSAGCLQDVRVVYADGRSEERRRQDTCGLVEMVFGGGAPAGRPGQPPAASGNPSFNLVNHGGMVIREVYVSSARETNWGLDRLGDQVLPPGRHLAVRLPLNDCVNDIRIVWVDGRNEERRRIDTCAMVNMVFQ